MSKVRGKSPTICLVETMDGKKYGAFTDIAWSTDNKVHKNKGNSFIFKFDSE